MVLSIYLGLMLIALGALFVSGRQRLGGVLLLLCVGSFFLYQLGLPVDGAQTLWRYDWLPSAGLHSSLNLNFDSLLRRNLFPVMAATLWMIYLALFCGADCKKRDFSSLLILGIGAFVVLRSSVGLVQLMAGSCLYTVIGFYLIDRIEFKKKYLFYHFIGEMALFVACAVIYGSVGTVNLSKCIASYISFGEHKDLVSALLLVAVFAKAGLFPFQNAVADTQDMAFTRIIALTTIIMPVSALLLFSKVYPFIVAASSVNIRFVFALSGISLLWGLGGGLVLDSLKIKVIYINLISVSTAFVLLCENQALSQSVEFFYFIPLLVMIDCLVWIVVSSASNEIYLSQMGGFIKVLKPSFVISLLGMMVLIAVFSQAQLVVQVGVIFILMIMAHILRNVYLGKTKADERVWALLKNVSILILLPQALFFCYALYRLLLPEVSKFQAPESYLLGLGCVGFVLFLCFNPLKFVLRWADNDQLQEADILEKIYNGFVLMPLRLLGRILWITIDFLFIERTVIASLSQTTGLIVGGLHKIQAAAWLNYLVMVMIGLGFFVIFAGRYYYE